MRVPIFRCSTKTIWVMGGRDKPESLQGESGHLKPHRHDDISVPVLIFCCRPHLSGTLVVFEIHADLCIICRNNEIHQVLTVKSYLNGTSVIGNLKGLPRFAKI